MYLITINYEFIIIMEIERNVLLMKTEMLPCSCWIIIFLPYPLFLLYNVHWLVFFIIKSVIDDDGKPAEATALYTCTCRYSYFLRLLVFSVENWFSYRLLLGDHLKKIK